jgi:hypothetical protein
MRRLARGGRWQINVPGARLWMLAEGLHLVWPAGAEDIVALLAADRVPGIPRDPDTLADILLERGLAVPRQEGDHAQRYWRLAPAPLARDGQVVTLTVLRLNGEAELGAVPVNPSSCGRPLPIACGHRSRPRTGRTNPETRSRPFRRGDADRRLALRQSRGGPCLGKRTGCAGLRADPHPGASARLSRDPRRRPGGARGALT